MPSITTLSENTASQTDFLAEFGISMLVEFDKLKVLFDTGYSFSAFHNARLLGIDSNQIDKIILSHSHHDHTGGLRDILMGRVRKTSRFNILEASEIEVIAHPNIFAEEWFVTEGELKRYIGMRWTRCELEQLGAKFNLSTEPVWLTENMVTSGEVPLITSYEKVDRECYIKNGKQFQHDEIRDDLSLVIKTKLGLVVVTGCAHRGIVNILHRAQELTGVNDIYAVIGGTHLFRADEEQLEATIQALKEFNIKKMGVSHCTGLAAATRLAHEFGDKFFFNMAGTRTILP